MWHTIHKTTRKHQLFIKKSKQKNRLGKLTVKDILFICSYLYKMHLTHGCIMWCCSWVVLQRRVDVIDYVDYENTSTCVKCVDASLFTLISPNGGFCSWQCYPYIDLFVCVTKSTMAATFTFLFSFKTASFIVVSARWCLSCTRALSLSLREAPRQRLSYMTLSERIKSWLCFPCGFLCVLAFSRKRQMLLAEKTTDSSLSWKFSSVFPHTRVLYVLVRELSLSYARACLL